MMKAQTSRGPFEVHTYGHRSYGIKATVKTHAGLKVNHQVTGTIFTNDRGQDVKADMVKMVKKLNKAYKFAYTRGITRIVLTVDTPHSVAGSTQKVLLYVYPTSTTGYDWVGSTNYNELAIGVPDYDDYLRQINLNSHPQPQEPITVVL